MAALHLLGEPRVRQVEAMLKEEPRESVACFACARAGKMKTCA
jgi:hypothetical protein